MVQQTIFDQVKKAEELKQQGIEAVYRHANSDWKREAAKQLQHVIATRLYFCSDDIVMPLEERGLTTGNTSAIAAILKSACRLELIKSTENYVKSRRATRHGSPILRWESLVFKGIDHDDF